MKRDSNEVYLFSNCGLVWKCFALQLNSMSHRSLLFRIPFSVCAAEGFLFYLIVSRQSCRSLKLKATMFEDIEDVSLFCTSSPYKHHEKCFSFAALSVHLNRETVNTLNRIILTRWWAFVEFTPFAYNCWWWDYHANAWMHVYLFFSVKFIL